MMIPWSANGQRGTFDVCLSTSRNGHAASSALARTIRVDSELTPPLDLFPQDIRAVWPRGGRAWCVVRYSETVVASFPVAV